MTSYILALVLVSTTFQAIVTGKETSGYLQMLLNHPQDKIADAAKLLFTHKYWGMDTRYEGLLDEKVYSRHFPIPRLKRLHPKVLNACSKGAEACIEEVSTTGKDFGFPRNLTYITNPEWPFKSKLDMFQYKTTATYFLCWFTLKRNALFKKIHPGYHDSFNYKRTKKEYLCTDVFLTYREYTENPKLHVDDFRTDRTSFTCAEVLFCPDPCYGRGSSGNVPSLSAALKDNTNPCRSEKDKTCGWANTNRDMDTLMRNKFNITCVCDEIGFRWNSKYKMCVDIDECYEGSKNCGNDRMCVNTRGGAVCLCKMGTVENPDTGVCGRFTDIVDPPKSNRKSRRKQKKKKKDNELPFMRMIEILLGISTGSRVAFNVVSVISPLLTLYFCYWL